MHLTEVDDIKKRWQEYTEELYKKDLKDQDNHDGVITHLEPDILECEVKWALESITTPALYRHMMPEANQQFARMAVEVWGLNPAGKSQEELAAAFVDALADFIEEICR